MRIFHGNVIFGSKIISLRSQYKKKEARSFKKTLGNNGNIHTKQTNGHLPLRCVFGGKYSSTLGFHGVLLGSLLSPSLFGNFLYFVTFVTFRLMFIITYHYHHIRIYFFYYSKSLSSYSDSSLLPQITIVMFSLIIIIIISLYGHINIFINYN